MKKTYETPTVQMMTFRYRDQVVVASGGVPSAQSDITDPTCPPGNDWLHWLWDVISGCWIWKT